jgi:polysaccharide chain length determinant protein (PEP-CTERM system associated)
MREIIEQVKVYLKMVWQHHWLALICAALICFGGWFVVAILPSTYHVKATFQVQRYSMLAPLLKGMALKSESLRGLVGVLRQTMLSKANLEKVALETGLIDTNSSQHERDAVVDDLEDAINVKEVEDQELVYTVAFDDADPHLAQQVVQVLLATFSETVSSTIQAESDSTKRFMDEQIAEYKIKMDKADENVREFKRLHPEVPEDPSGYNARMDEIRRHAEDNYAELKQAENELDAIRAEPAGPATVGGGRRHSGMPSPMDSRIADMQSKLSELQLKFTEQHPDVLALKRNIETLKQQRLHAPQDGGSADDDGPGPMANPMYQNWRMQVARSQARVNSLRSRGEEFKQRIEKMQKELGPILKLQTELAKLIRDYTVTKESYQSLVQKSEQASLSDKLERSSDLKINIVQPPKVPLRPLERKPIQMNTMVLCAGLGVGIGLAIMLAQLRPVIYTRQELAALSELPVLGGLSLSGVLRPQQPFLLRNLTFFGLFAGLLVTYTLVNALYFFDAGILRTVANLRLLG